MATIECEQAVYGSFPGWSRGYDLLGSSPGCLPGWLTYFRQVCQGYGEPPRGFEPGGLLSRPLPSGGLLVVRPSTAGRDDHGRPGALAFHALFAADRDWRRYRLRPFQFASALKEHWTADSTIAGPIRLEVKPPRDHAPVDSPLVTLMATGLTGGLRYGIESPRSIEPLAQAVWERLPHWRQRRLHLATWTFSNRMAFDLFAAPRLHGMDVDERTILVDGSAADLGEVGRRTEILLWDRRPWFFRAWRAGRRIS